MLSIILPAAEIPDGTTVRKITGQQTFTLHRELKVFTVDSLPDGAAPRQVVASPGIMYLLGNSINAIRDDTRLVIDFQTPDDAIQFLQILQMEKRGD